MTIPVLGLFCNITSKEESKNVDISTHNCIRHHPVQTRRALSTGHGTCVHSSCGSGTAKASHVNGRRPSIRSQTANWSDFKSECTRPGTPLSIDDARQIVEKHIEHDNTVRRHSAIGYVTPSDKLNGRDKEIFKERDRKL